MIMKFTEYEMEVLRSFNQINPSIIFNPGHKVATISNNKNILASANFKQVSFPKQAPIYDLSNLISSINILATDDKPDINFGDNLVTLEQKRSKIKYYYAEPRMVTTPPETIQDLGAPVVSTVLQHSQLLQIERAASTYQLPDICFTGEKGVLTAVVTDKRNSSSNSLEIELGKVEGDFCFCMKIENLSVINLRGGQYTPCSAYDLDIYAAKVARFTGVITKGAEDYVSSLEYLIALEPDSEY